jgi:hypothetical protein
MQIIMEHARVKDPHNYMVMVLGLCVQSVLDARNSPLHRSNIWLVTTFLWKVGGKLGIRGVFVNSSISKVKTHRTIL